MWLAERGKVNNDVPESIRAPPELNMEEKGINGTPEAASSGAGAFTGRLAKACGVNSIQIHLAAASDHEGYLAESK